MNTYLRILRRLYNVYDLKQALVKILAVICTVIGILGCLGSVAVPYYWGLLFFVPWMLLLALPLLTYAYDGDL